MATGRAGRCVNRVCRWALRWLRVLASWLLRARILVALTLMVVAIWTGLVLSHDRNTTLDTFILGEIATVFTLACLVFLLGTQVWTLRGTGQFLTYAGVAWWLGGVTLARLDVLDRNPEWVLDLARACFLVGGTALFTGLVLWLGRRFSRRFDRWLVRRERWYRRMVADLQLKDPHE